MVIGYVIHNAHAQDSRRLQLSSMLYPTLMALTVLVSLHIAGFIGTSVASTKDFILQHALFVFTTLGPSVVVVAFATLLYTLGYVFSTVYDIFLRYRQPQSSTTPVHDLFPPAVLLILGTACLLYTVEAASLPAHTLQTAEVSDVDLLGFSIVYALVLAQKTTQEVHSPNSAYVDY